MKKWRVKKWRAKSGVSEEVAIEGMTSEEVASEAVVSPGLGQHRSGEGSASEQGCRRLTAIGVASYLLVVRYWAQTNHQAAAIPGSRLSSARLGGTD